MDITLRGNKKKIKHCASQVRAVILDVDGVLTDGRVLEGTSSKSKWRSYYDGQGISLLRAIGLRVCIITNEKGEYAQSIAEVVDKWNKLKSSASEENPQGWPHVKLYTGVDGQEKVTAAERWLKDIGVSFKESAFMGDDVVDAQLLKKVGLSAAPISAEQIIKEMVDFISERPAGYGAARDLANFIIEVRGIDPLTLAHQ